MFGTTVILIILTIIAFTLVYFSVLYLKVDVKSYYGFDSFLSNVGTWSVVFYLIILVGLSLALYLMINLNIPIQPA